MANIGIFGHLRGQRPVPPTAFAEPVAGFCPALRSNTDCLLSPPNRAPGNPRFFGLALSQFAYWVFLLSTPLVAPFNNLLSPLSYDGYIIEVSTLVAIIVYALVVTIARQFLKVLVG